MENHIILGKHKETNNWELEIVPFHEIEKDCGQFGKCKEMAPTIEGSQLLFWYSQYVDLTDAMASEKYSIAIEECLPERIAKMLNLE